MPIVTTDTTQNYINNAVDPSVTTVVTTHTTVVTFANLTAAKSCQLGRVPFYFAVQNSSLFPEFNDALDVSFTAYDKTISISDNEAAQSLTGDQISSHLSPVGSTLINVYHENPVSLPWTEETDGTPHDYINSELWQDRYFLYVPTPGTNAAWTDFAVDVDLPYPWGNCRLIYAGGLVILSSRTAPGGWTASPRRRHGGDSVLDAGRTLQFQEFGDATFVQNSYNVMNFSQETFSTTRGLPTFRLGGVQFSTVLDTPTLSSPAVTAQWAIVSYDSTNADGVDLIGSSFTLPVAGGNLTQFVSPQDLPSPSIPNGREHQLQLKVDYSDAYYSYTVYLPVQKHVPSILESYGRIWISAYQVPSYYPHTTQLRQLAENESGINFVRHAGYIPTSTQPQIALTSTAPTLVRSGSVVSVSSGGWVNPSSPADGHASTGFRGLFRITCPDIGAEWRAPEYGITETGNTLSQTPIDDPLDENGNPVVGTFPGPSIVIPSRASGFSLFGEVIVSQLISGDVVRRTIKKWIVSVP